MSAATSIPGWLNHAGGKAKGSEWAEETLENGTAVLAHIDRNNKATPTYLHHRKVLQTKWVSHQRSLFLAHGKIGKTSVSLLGEFLTRRQWLARLQLKDSGPRAYSYPTTMCGIKWPLSGHGSRHMT